MAMDFPASPVVGTVFTYAGLVYTFNGTGWTLPTGTEGGGGEPVPTDAYTKAETDAQHAQHQIDFVNATGDTMSGGLTISAPTFVAALQLHSTTDNYTKTLRIGGAGAFEIINNANSAAVMTLSDGGALTVTGTALIGTNLTVGININAQDIYAVRSGGPTGYIFFGNSGSRYIGYDGTRYSIPFRPVAINAPEAGADAVNVDYLNGRLNAYQPAGNYQPAGSYQPALGFTPAQQSGGAYMTTNKVYIGWDGPAGKMRLQVDGTPLGFINTQDSATLVTSVRLSWIGDRQVSGANPEEPWMGAVLVGGSGAYPPYVVYRYRWLQYFTNDWYNVGVV